MRLQTLQEKSKTLPTTPGVYLMCNDAGEIIYVGKAKSLKDRVSQYFMPRKDHTEKTRQMAMHVHDFETILTNSEFEALVLECSLIKKYAPKYNIKLKENGGYPFIRLTREQEYPRFEIAYKKGTDKAEYFGPYSRKAAYNILDTMRGILGLPSCKKSFPKDFGKQRPCLEYNINRCIGLCKGDVKKSHYMTLIEQGVLLLKGDYKKLSAGIEAQMEEAAEKLEFEKAAALRDRLNSIKHLGAKQQIITNKLIDIDIVGSSLLGNKLCFAVLHVLRGSVTTKDEVILDCAADDFPELLASFLKQYYTARASYPRHIIIPEAFEDMPLLEEYFFNECGKKVTFIVPQRGDKKQLLAMANLNAQETLSRMAVKAEREQKGITALEERLGISTISRIESFDISNTSGSNIVGAMVVFGREGKKSSEYRLFKIKGKDTQDDYFSMKEVLRRRFENYLDGEKGFAELPDLLLIDGGENHAKAVRDELTPLGITVPIYGLVKDDRHRTRALVSPGGDMLSIQTNPTLFAFLGRIQEETHRFAITYHRKLRDKVE